MNSLYECICDFDGISHDHDDVRASSSDDNRTFVRVIV